MDWTKELTTRRQDIPLQVLNSIQEQSEARIPTLINTGLYDQLESYKEPDSCIRRALLKIPLHRAVLNERGIELLDKEEERCEKIVPPNKSLRLAFRSYPERPPQSSMSYSKMELSPHMDNRTTSLVSGSDSKVLPARIPVATARAIKINRPKLH